MVVLDFYLVAKYSDCFDDGLNELVFLDGIHEVPDGVEVRKGFADLFRGEVATVFVQFLRFRENPKEDLRLGQHNLDVVHGEDEEDEYAINPAHESDKPVKRMSLLNAAVEVLKAAGPEHPMNCKEILEAILDRHLWPLTDCKTPEQMIYGSIFREINNKEHPRIKKSDVKGKFVIVA